VFVFLFSNCWLVGLLMLVDDRVETPLKAVHIFTILHQVDRPLSVSSQLLDSACQPLDGLLDRLRFRLRLAAAIGAGALCR